MESDADIAEPIKSLLSSLESRSAELERAEDSGEDAPKIIENFLSSVFPGLVFRTESRPTPPTEQAQSSISDKGKGKARAAGVEELQEPTPKSESTGGAFADVLRHIMELSKSAPAPRSPDEAGPSGSSSSHTSAQQVVTEREQAQIDRAIALSSVEHIQNTLDKLQSGFVLPTELDYYPPPTDDRDETGSVSSVSSSNLTKLIPYTSANKAVYRYENELNGLLEELDRIDSQGDVEVREKRKEVVKAIDKALEGVERVVGEAIEKKPSHISASALATDGRLQGFNVDEDTVGEAIVVGGATIPEPSTPAWVEQTSVVPTGGPSPVEEVLPKSDTPIPSETTTDPISIEPDVESSMATITPPPVKLESAAETRVTGPQVQMDVLGTVDPLLPEKASQASPVQELQQKNDDSDEEVLSLGSDGEKSDWSELEP